MLYRVKQKSVSVSNTNFNVPLITKESGKDKTTACMNSTSRVTVKKCEEKIVGVSSTQLLLGIR